MIHFGEFFDALVLLHRGEAHPAVALLDEAPEEFVNHYNGMWRAWYASVWGEAAVLAALPDAGVRLERARVLTGGNPVVEAILVRARGLLEGGEMGRADLAAAATSLHALGARYQWARTLVMLGGDDRERGEQALAALRAAPMPWPR